MEAHQAHYRIYLQAYSNSMRGFPTPSEGASLPVLIAIAIASFDTAGDEIDAPRTLGGFIASLGQMMSEETNPCA